MPKLKRKVIFTILAASSLSVIGLVLCCVLFAGGSAGGTLASGRQVMTHSDSIYLSSTFSSEVATIKTGGKLIVVEPTQLIVDGMPVAEIDKNISSVEVHLKRGNVSFVADGKLVQMARRR